MTAKLFPAQNCFGASCLGNFHLSTTLPNNTDQQTYRLDQNIGKFGSIFFRYTKADYLLDTASTTSIPAGLNIFTENSTSWEISHTISLPHGFVNNFRFGYLGAKVIQGDSPAPTCGCRLPWDSRAYSRTCRTMRAAIPTSRFRT